MAQNQHVQVEENHFYVTNISLYNFTDWKAELRAIKGEKTAALSV
jgi:hypothetical protein